LRVASNRRGVTAGQVFRLNRRFAKIKTPRTSTHAGAKHEDGARNVPGRGETITVARARAIIQPVGLQS
jgi:hypothetical protein